MSTITAILEPFPDGTLHLPVPEAWRNLPIRITAEMEPAGNRLEEAYTEEWQRAFGSIDDLTFEVPARRPGRPTGPLDTD